MSVREALAQSLYLVVEVLLLHLLAEPVLLVQKTRVLTHKQGPGSSIQVAEHLH